MSSTSQQRFPQLPEEFGKEMECLCTAQESQSMKTFSVSLQCWTVSATSCLPHFQIFKARGDRYEPLVWLVHKKDCRVSSNDFHIQLNKLKLKWSICFQNAFNFCRTNKILPPLKSLSEVPFASGRPEFPTKLPSDPEFTISLAPLIMLT